MAGRDEWLFGNGGVDISTANAELAPCSSRLRRVREMSGLVALVLSFRPAGERNFEIAGLNESSQYAV